MKVFSSEYIKDYKTYSFGYTRYCIKESPQELPEIYAQGFLPYSANLDLAYDLFYMARSLRISLERFDDSSENKRVIKKMEELNPKLETSSKKEINYYSDDFIKFCLDYAAARFSNSSMNEKRLLHILNKPIGTHIFSFKSSADILGYVLAVVEQNILHYWFSFFDLTYLKSHSLGKYMMWRICRWAKDQGLDAMYLGTCYGTHSLYKVRDFKGVEYWNGVNWSDDKNLLKALCKEDDQPKTKDLFKSLEQPNDFLRNLLES